jgi:hypothetical protein
MTGDRPQEPRAGDAAELEQDRVVGGIDLTRWNSRLGAALARVGGRIGTRASMP